MGACRVLPLNGGATHGIFQELERAALGGDSPSVTRQGGASANRPGPGDVPPEPQGQEPVCGHAGVSGKTQDQTARRMQGGPAPWSAAAHHLLEPSPARPESPLWPRIGTAGPAQPQQAAGKEGLREVFRGWRSRAWRAPGLSARVRGLLKREGSDPPWAAPSGQDINPGCWHQGHHLVTCRPPSPRGAHKHISQMSPACPHLCNEREAPGGQGRVACETKLTGPELSLGRHVLGGRPGVYGTMSFRV